MPHQRNRNLARRRPLRLANWDYTTPAVYFVTICTHKRAHLFTETAFTDVALHAWQAIPTQRHATHVYLDEWVVMPNHLHGLLVLTEVPLLERPQGLTLAQFPFPLATRYSTVAKSTPGVARGSLGAVVGNFKSLVARRMNNLRRSPGAPVWQRGYYERIVRNVDELEKIRRYVRDNPIRWAEDRDNLDHILSRMRLVMQ